MGTIPSNHNLLLAVIACCDWQSQWSIWKKPWNILTYVLLINLFALQHAHFSGKLDMKKIPRSALQNQRFHQVTTPTSNFNKFPYINQWRPQWPWCWNGLGICRSWAWSTKSQHLSCVWELDSSDPHGKGKKKALMERHIYKWSSRVRGGWIFGVTSFGIIFVSQGKHFPNPHHHHHHHHHHKALTGRNIEGFDTLKFDFVLVISRKCMKHCPPTIVY